MSKFITFKRWTLKQGRQEAELIRLVREEIIPHYKKMPGCLRLGLLHVGGSRSYMALQYWQNRETWRAATRSDDYRAWYEAYKPILERWDELMTFEEEWECEDMLDSGNE